MRNWNITYRVVRSAVGLFFKVYGHWEVCGRENVPRKGGCIVVSNHISYLDPPLMGCTIPRLGHFMAKSDLWQNKFLAWIMPKLNVYPIQKGKPDLASIRYTLEKLESGYPVGLFPEGTRSKSGRLLPGEPGVALLIKKSGVPVVPMVIIGANKMLPVGAKRIYRARLKTVFGDPIFFTPDCSREEIIREVMRSLARLLTENGIPMKAAEDLPEEERNALLEAEKKL